MNNFIKLAIATIFAAILALPVAVQAKRIDSDKAEKLAQHFIESKHGLKTKANVRLKHISKKHYYVFGINENKGGGFVIVSGDDAVKPVLGYSDSGIYDENNLPPNFAYWMEYLEQQIALVQEQGLEQSEPVQQEWNAVSPLIQTQWTQSAPYNNMTPEWNGQRTATGCVATTMAQLMKYYNYPAQGTGSSPAYTTTTNKISIPSVNFGATTYDWDNMQDKYSSSTSSTPQNNAVATLMYHAGVSVRMDYTPNSSGAITANVSSALKNYFGYNKDIKQMTRSLNEANWETVLRGQINAGMPVYYAGRNSSGGHAFILDGYDSTGKFHFNWGWGGLYDGYFVSSALNPGTGGIGAGLGTYNQNQEIIIDIKPNNADAPPTIVKHPSNQIVPSGETAQFEVVATSNGVNPLTYQWQVSTNTITVADTIAHEDFEGSTNSFTFVNGSETNKWVVGNAIAGTKSAYISNDSISNAYTTTSESIVHMYRDITFPVFQACTLWFNIRGMGEANNDYLAMRLMETSFTPTAGSNPPTSTGSSWRVEASSWMRTYFVIPASSSGTKKRLVFTWRNNASGGTNPPIAVDNITITRPLVKAGESPFKNVSGGTGSTTATYTTAKVTEAMSGYRYRCLVRGNNGLPSTSNFAKLTIGTPKTIPTASIFTYNASAIYNGKPQSINLATAQGITGLGAITVKYNNSTTVPVSAGTYAITVDIAEGSSYAAATGISLGNYTIDKANPVLALPSSITAIFGDSLLNVALPKGWIWEESGVVGMAGMQTHKATFTPTDTANYNVATGIGIMITVAKANPSYVAPTGLIAIFGDSLSNVALPEGWIWEESGVVGNIGEQVHSAAFMPADTANYKVVRGIDLIITVNKNTMFISINNIVLQNLPPNTKIKVYNLQGKLVYSTTSHSPLATSLTIMVQTKGMYIVKIGNTTISTVVR